LYIVCNLGVILKPKTVPYFYSTYQKTNTFRMFNSRFSRFTQVFFKSKSCFYSSKSGFDWFWNLYATRDLLD